MSTTGIDLPLAIVGMGCLFPKASSIAEFWNNIKNGIDAIGPVPPTHWRPEDYFDSDARRPDFTYAQRGGFLDPYPFNPAEFGIAPRDLEAIDTAQLLGLVVARMALDDAGLLEPDANRKRVSVILGVTGTLEMVVPLGARLGHPLWRKALRDAGVPETITTKVIAQIADGYVGWQENSFPGLLGNVVAGRIANRFDLGGTNCVVDAACASSLSALHMAALELAAGRSDAVLTGGVDAFNDIFMYMCFSKTPALSPTGDARPFSNEADGTILGEGLGLLVLKRLDDAIKAGDRIHAVIKGMGTSSDGRGNAVYAPVASGQKEALQRAYAAAAVDPMTIDLVEGHGTGTKVGDAVELSALTDVYRAHQAAGTWCAIGSVKSQIGHTKAAAGAAAIIKAVLALKNRVLPPTIKVQSPAPALANEETPFYVNTTKRPWIAKHGQPRRAAVSSFGFGGSNFHAVLEEHPTAPTEVDWSGATQILAFSGSDRTTLERQLEAVNTNDWNELSRVAAESRCRFNHTDPERMTCVVVRGGDKPAIKTAHAGTGAAEKLGILFPGQGSQYVGMLRDLVCQFLDAHAPLDLANQICSRGVYPERRLSDHIFPYPVFSAEAKAEQEKVLRDTATAQPALGAINLAALRIVRRFGVIPDAVAGHSYGELVALCAAGCFDEQMLLELSLVRGRLMAEQAKLNAGAMLAVKASREATESIVASELLGIVIANHNSPTQVVISGTTAEVERAEHAFAKRQIRCVRLPVAAAFHSPLVAIASGSFASALQQVAVRAPKVPVFSNTTTTEYPHEAEAIRELVSSQLAQPVDFVLQIRNMYESGVRVFLEVGPGHVLTRLVDSILGDLPHATVCIDASAGRNPGEVDLAHALAQLAAAGHPVRLELWDPDPARPQPKAAFAVPICGANYRPERPERKVVTQVPSQEPKREIMAEQSKPTQPTTPIPQPAVATRLDTDALQAFLRLQEQTADVHRLFLEQQLQAQRTLQALVNGHPIPLAVPTELPARTMEFVAPQAPAPVPSMPPQPKVTPRRDAPTVPVPHPVISQPTRVGGALSTTDVLLAVVAEKTGYPVAMLDLDMGLDADLGIDSIKRVEILSAMQDRMPHLPSVPADRLGSIQTLREVVELLGAGLPAEQSDTVTDQPSQLANTLLAVVAEKTGYPTSMLNLDMGLDADLGIDSIKRVEILSTLQERLPDTPAVPAERLGSLQTLREVIELLQAPEKKNQAKPLLI